MEDERTLIALAFVVVFALGAIAGDALAVVARLFSAMTSDHASIDAMSKVDVSRSVAKSTAQLASYQLATFVVGIFTLIGLGWTIKLGRLTTAAAIRSASAVEQSERAHVYVTLEPCWNKVDGTCNVEFQVRNYGRTPAEMISYYVIQRIDGAEQSSIDHDIVFLNRDDFESGRTNVRTVRQLNDWLLTKKPYYVMVIGTYRTVIDRDKLRHFAATAVFARLDAGVVPVWHVHHGPYKPDMDMSVSTWINSDVK